MRVRAGWVAWAWALGACAPAPIGTPVAASELCAELARIACDAETECCARVATDCEERQLDACRAALEPLALDPRLGYDAEGAGAFLESVRASAAGCWRGGGLDALRPMLAGTGALDADCTPSVTRGSELLAASLSCTGDAACRIHLLTDGSAAGACEPRTDDGCSHARDCAADEHCNLGSAWEPGVWGRCQPLRTDGWACASDLECASRYCAAGTCAPRPASRSCLVVDYDEVILEDRPLAYWRLGDRDRRTAIDASGHGHDARYVGAATLEVSGAIAEERDGAMRVEAERYLRAPAIDALPRGTGLTLEAWFRSDDVESIHPILELADGEEEVGVHVWAFERGDQIYANFVGADGASHTVMSEPAAIVAGSWHHVVATHDGSRGRLYLDGALVGDVAIDPVRVADLDLFVGHRQAIGDAPARALAGAVDEVAIYDHALGEAAIRRHHRAGVDGTATNELPLFGWLR